MRRTTAQTSGHRILRQTDTTTMSVNPLSARSVSQSGPIRRSGTTFQIVSRRKWAAIKAQCWPVYYCGHDLSTYSGIRRRTIPSQWVVAPKLAGTKRVWQMAPSLATSVGLRQMPGDRSTVDGERRVAGTGPNRRQARASTRPILTRSS